MNRPKYKALYHEEKARNRQLDDALDLERRHRQRLKAVLIDHAERVVLPRLQQLPPTGNESVLLEPIDFVAYEETLVANQRYTNEFDEILSLERPRPLAWRARRVTLLRALP